MAFHFTLSTNCSPESLGGNCTLFSERFFLVFSSENWLTISTSERQKSWTPRKWFWRLLLCISFSCRGNGSLVLVPITLCRQCGTVKLLMVKDHKSLHIKDIDLHQNKHSWCNQYKKYTRVYEDVGYKNVQNVRNRKRRIQRIVRI